MSALRLARADDRLQQLKYEPPRSWSREAKLRFLELPESLQVYLVAREKERDREVRLRQNEAAEARKALAAAEARIAELEKPNVHQASEDPLKTPINCGTGKTNGV